MTDSGYSEKDQLKTHTDLLKSREASFKFYD